jgi:hypothetical protein
MHTPQRHPVWAYIGKSNECWIWMGTKNRHGYGIYENQAVHRLTYRLAGNTIPRQHALHHICGNRGCVNPEHLTPVTFAEHMAIHRAAAKSA